MFKSLQKRWGISGVQLFWILCVFAITGTTTAYVTKVITGWVGLGRDSHWAWKTLLRAGVLIFGYQAILLVVAFLLGQFSFFWNYEKKILARLRLIRPKHNNSIMRLTNPTNIAIFASGAGSNARRIISYFQNRQDIVVALIVCNKEGAGVLEIAKEHHIPTLLIERERFFRGDAYLPELEGYEINFIVLAGFLWKIPLPLVQLFKGRMINIHPALLPLYGGKGMYGQKVHAAVLEAGDKETGITIHHVTEHYDEGGIIFQAKCEVLPTDDPETLSKKIHQLEHSHFPRIIEEVIQQKESV